MSNYVNTVYMTRDIFFRVHGVFFVMQTELVRDKIRENAPLIIAERERYVTPYLLRQLCLK